MKEDFDEQYAPWWAPFLVLLGMLALLAMVVLVAAVQDGKRYREIQALDKRVQALEER